MHGNLSIALLAGIGGMLGWGFADFFAKKTIDVIGSIKTLVWAHFFGTSFFVLFALAHKLFYGANLHLPHTAGSWLGLAFFGTLQMIVYYLVYQGFGKGQLAVLNPVFASYSGIVALASVVLFGERLSPLLALALVVIFAGVLLINTDLKGLRSKKLHIVPGLKEVGGAAVLASIWTLGWDRFVKGHDAVTYALFMYAFMSLAALVLTKIIKEKSKVMPPSMWKFVVIIGLGETVAYLAISWGYGASTLTSTIALVSGSFSLPTLILAHAYLKEQVTRLQTFAALIIVAGIAVTALS